MNDFIVGAITMAYYAAGLFFLRYWRQTRDRLFLIFALALWLLGGMRLAMKIGGGGEADPVYSLMRFVAFALILVAIIDKNRNKSPGAP